MSQQSESTKVGQLFKQNILQLVGHSGEKVSRRTFPIKVCTLAPTLGQTNGRKAAKTAKMYINIYIRSYFYVKYLSKFAPRSHSRGRQMGEKLQKDFC